MDDLADRLVQGAGIVDRREGREAHRHPLGEVLLARPRAEDPQERADRPVARRHGRQHRGERGPTRPPELVRVRVDHPVRAVLRGREPRHPRHPFVLAQVLTGLADQAHLARPRVLLEHLRGAVLRVVVGCDHDVDAGIQMEREPRVDDVDLVPGQERHDEGHRRASLRATRRPARGSGRDARRSDSGTREIAVAGRDAGCASRGGEAASGSTGSHATSQGGRAAARGEPRTRARRPACPRARLAAEARSRHAACTAARRTARASLDRAVCKECPDEPLVIGMGERRAGDEQEVRAVHGVRDRAPNHRRRLRVARSRRSRTGARSGSRPARRTLDDPPRAVREPTPPPSRSRRVDPSPRQAPPSPDRNRAR